LAPTTDRARSELAERPCTDSCSNPTLAFELAFAVELVLGSLVKVVKAGDAPDMSRVVTGEFEHPEVERDVVGRRLVLSAGRIDENFLGYVIKELSPERVEMTRGPGGVSERTGSTNLSWWRQLERDHPGRLALGVVGHPDLGILVHLVEKCQHSGIGKPIVTVELDDNRVAVNLADAVKGVPGAAAAP
jgi:hypothetical protein